MTAAACLGVATVSAAPCLLPPVDSPVVDPYREPACPWCSGHRGIGYRPAPGTPVRAVAPGRVTFAGVVAGVRWVTVGHADDLRSSYGHLASARVRVGQWVGVGQVLGASGPLLHLGLRRGDRYVDPTPLLGRPVGRPRLVPVVGPGGRPTTGRPTTGRPVIDRPGAPGSRTPAPPRPVCTAPTAAPAPVVATRSPR